MKKKLQIILLLIVTSVSGINAQWCIPLTAIPYNANMPGITHVVVNTIDRTSADLENYPNNSYVNTGLTTELFTGTIYSISITFTIDATICPDMNLRVWIDYNQDGQLDDIGETAISVNNQLPGTYTGTFTIPQSATLGMTRMRVTAKMSPNGGHTMPTPCDDPADPLGYHGEFEDYNVIIGNVTGINSPVLADNFKVYYSQNKIDFSFSINENLLAGINMTDLQGKIIKELLPLQKLSAGNYSYTLNEDESAISPGIYLAVFSTDDKRIVKKIIIE